VLIQSSTITKSMLQSSAHQLANKFKSVEAHKQLTKSSPYKHF